MKKIICLCMYIFLSTSIIQAQWKITEIEGWVNPGINFNTFSSDSLIFKKRQKQGTVSTSVQSAILMKLSNGSRTSFHVGIGLRSDQFDMNQNNLGDAFFAIFIIPFGGRPTLDTLGIDHINIHSSSITMPIGISYCITKNKRNAVQFYFRTLFTSGLLLHTNAIADIATINSSPVIAPAVKESIEMLYEKGIQKFSLNVAPEFFFATGSKRKVGFALGVQPIAFDIVQPSKKYLEGIWQFRASMGLVYRL